MAVFTVLTSTVLCQKDLSDIQHFYRRDQNVILSNLSFTLLFGK